MNFNVKSKFNYDMEFGSNQVYQLIYGKEIFEENQLLIQSKRLGFNAQKKIKKIGDQAQEMKSFSTDVKFPN